MNATLAVFKWTYLQYKGHYLVMFLLFYRPEQEPKETLRAAKHPVLVPGGWRQRPSASSVPCGHRQREWALVSPGFIHPCVTVTDTQTALTAQSHS